MYNNGYQKILKSNDKNTKYFIIILIDDDAFEYIKKINAKEKTLFLEQLMVFIPKF